MCFYFDILQLTYFWLIFKWILGYFVQSYFGSRCNSHINWETTRKLLLFYQKHILKNTYAKCFYFCYFLTFSFDNGWAIYWIHESKYERISGSCFRMLAKPGMVGIFILSYCEKVIIELCYENFEMCHKMLKWITRSVELRLLTWKVFNFLLYWKICQVVWLGDVFLFL